MNLRTRIRSAVMRHLSSETYLLKQRRRAARQRAKQQIPPTVHYFHQVDDPYSHLAVQKLQQLQTRYALRFSPHLVCAPAARYQGDADHYIAWAVEDAKNVAAGFDTWFEPAVDTLPEKPIRNANQTLANVLASTEFAEAASEIGYRLWRGDSQVDAQPEKRTAEQALADGNSLREALGHYQGAVFYFEGEWFWGLDRVNLLEQRLQAEGYDTQSGGTVVTEPVRVDLQGKQASNIVLEYFPSLRSPYTAIGHARVQSLIERTGVQVKLRPVMPMMMRGIPAPRAKQRYIIMDAGREGRRYGAPFGRIVDPFGEPVRRAFRLFPAADEQGLGMAFITAYLNAAWFQGVDITRESGLKQVVEQAGLNWQQLNQQADDRWQAELDGNLAALQEQHLWGVPSFRVSGGNADAPYACWGQDRIWRVENEIAMRAN